MNKIQQANAEAARVKAAGELVVKHGLPPAERAKPADSTPPASPTTEAIADAWISVIADMHERRKLGLERYGKPVSAGDGENYTQHLYEELLDAAVYLKARDEELAAARERTAELEREVERLTNILDAVCPSPDSGGGTVSVADQLAAQAEQITKLQAFKDWVHAYLDGKGVPKEIADEHLAAGCRIGGRMDWVFEQIAGLREALEEIRRQCGPKGSWGGTIATVRDIAEAALAAAHARGPKVPDSHPMAPFYTAFPSETTRGPVPAPEPDAKERERCIAIMLAWLPLVGACGEYIADNIRNNSLPEPEKP